MNPRRTSLRSTIDALSQALADAVLLAVRRTPLAELKGALEPARTRALACPPAPEAVRAPRRSEAPPPSPPARSRRGRRATAPRYEVELPLDASHAYPEVAIVDPDAVLGRLQAPENAPGPPIVSADEDESLPTSPPAPAAVSAPPAPATARSTTRLRPGEELLHAAGGGVVLRRRRPAPSPSSTP